MADKIGFGGGCHWCTEAVFQSIKGVNKVKQGWISSEEPYSDLSEAVIVNFNPDEIKIEELIQIHIETHSASSEHRMRKKYRSAVYYFEENQKALAKKEIDRLSILNDKTLITRVLPFKKFKLNTENFQNYYLKNPDKPFCQRYIKPKLDLLAKKEIG